MVDLKTAKGFAEKAEEEVVKSTAAEKSHLAAILALPCKRATYAARFGWHGSCSNNYLAGTEAAKQGRESAVCRLKKEDYGTNHQFEAGI